MGLATDFQEVMKFENLKFGEGLNGRAFPVIEYLHKVPGDVTDPDYINAIGDYSTTGVEFEISAFNGSDVYITSIHVLVEDSGPLDAGKYGNNITLTNGITLSLDWDGLLFFTTTPPIFKNLDYARQFNTPINDISFGSGNNAFLARASFDYNTNVPIQLRANTGDRVYFNLDDDFTGLEGHYFVMNGYLVNKPGAETFPNDP